MANEIKNNLIFTPISSIRFAIFKVFICHFSMILCTYLTCRLTHIRIESYSSAYFTDLYWINNWIFLNFLCCISWASPWSRLITDCFMDDRWMQFHIPCNSHTQINCDACINRSKCVELIGNFFGINYRLLHLFFSTKIQTDRRTFHLSKGSDC